MDKKPGFALLIAGKPKGEAEEPKEEEKMDDDTDHRSDLMSGEAAEDSAVLEMMDAHRTSDVPKYKAALKDFLEICYPSLADDADDKEETTEDSKPQEESEKPY